MNGIIQILAKSTEQVLAFATPQSLNLPALASDALPSEIVWMPAGTHAISAHTVGGGSFKGTVICDAQSARAISASFQEITSTGRRVWLDFNHDDGEASAWVKSFSWDPARGIIAHVEWSDEGAAALRGRRYYSFSPAFAAEKGTGRVVALLPGHAAGGLVNAPAFSAIPALIAARMSGFNTNQTASGADPAHETNAKMKDIILKLLAALKVTVPADATEEQIVALFTKHSAQETQNAELNGVIKEVVTLLAKQKTDADAKAKADADAKAETDAVAAKAKADLAIKAKADADARVAAEVTEIKAQLAAIRAGAGGSAAGPGVVTAKLNPIEAVKAMQNEKDPTKRGRIYCNELREFTSKDGVYEVLAANSFGTMVGDLVVLKALDLLKLRFPILSRVSTDFSNAAVKFGQTVRSRIVTVPTVTSYNTTTGYAVSDMTTVDVPVAINAHKSITVALNANDAASTGRDIFGEQVEAMNYALGKDLVDALYALFVIATYTNATTVAVASMTRATLPVALAQAFNTRGVPQLRRTLLLNAAAFAQMSIDPTIVQLATYQKPELVTGYALPEISGFQPIEAINLPATGNMAGFALTPDAAAIATRLPEDYTKILPGASYGNVQTVTNPDTGISVLKTDFVDHKLGSANSRIAWMYGVAAGQAASGQVVKTA